MSRGQRRRSAANDNLTPKPSHNLTVDDAGPATRETLGELRELLDGVASGRTPPRLAAVSYTRLRDALLESEIRTALPGFVLQCVSVYKFHEFICLYDARPDARVEFLERVFGGLQDSRAPRRQRDAFDDFDF